MKIEPNYLYSANKINNKKQSFGQNAPAENTVDVQSQTVQGAAYPSPNLNVRLPISYSHTEDIKFTDDITAHCYKLANGQKVVIVPKDGPTIIKSYINTGSFNEPDNLRGISHFIEHNLFNGSVDLGEKVFFDEVNKMGADTNASTSFDKTDYFISSNLLDEADEEKQIQLHAGMILSPKFLLDKLEKEKKIVNEEINMCVSEDENLGFSQTIKNLFNIKSSSMDLIAGTTDNISSYKFVGNKDIVHVNTVSSCSISKPYYIDSLFSENHYLIKKIEDGKAMLNTIAECENACSTHDAYELSSFVYNLTSDSNVSGNLRLVNTGTIDKFSNKWGIKEITYLGSKYIYPVVNRYAFTNYFGNAYVRKGTSQKLIFKGLNLLDGFIDFNGEYLPGKSTLVICSENIDDLKFLCGLLNSKLAIFYIKSKYASSSYCGGITFSKDMINNFPIVTKRSFVNDIVEVVDKILNDGYSNQLSNRLNEIIYLGYNLSSTDKRIIEQI